MNDDKDLDEILNRMKVEEYGTVSKKDTIHALNSHYYQKFLEIIGEDERIDIQSDFDKLDVPHLETDRYPGLDGVRQASRNILREHQRQQAKLKLLGR